MKKKIKKIIPVCILAAVIPASSVQAMASKEIMEEVIPVDFTGYEGIGSDKDKIKGEWTVSAIGFDDNGNYSALTSQTFVDMTIFPGTILQFDSETCDLWESYSDVDTYLDYHLQDGIIFFEKDDQEYAYTFTIDGDTLEFGDGVTSQTSNSDGSNSSNGGTMHIICTRNAEDNEETDFYDSDLYDVALGVVDQDIQEWVYDDLDGDGDKEAFIATGNGDDYYTEDGVKSLWFIESNGEATCLIDNAQYWYFSDTLMSCDNYKLLYVSARHGIYEVIGVKNDQPVIVSYPENYGFYWISQDKETGEVTAAAKHEEYAHVLEFDYDDMAFYDTGETTYIY